MVVDGRSKLGRRVADLAESFAVQLGGWPVLTDTMVAAVKKAAEMTALAEQARIDALRSGNIDPVLLVRLQGAADRGSFASIARASARVANESRRVLGANVAFCRNAHTKGRRRPVMRFAASPLLGSEALAQSAEEPFLACREADGAWRSA
jgi:hypothetical protein